MGDRPGPASHARSPRPGAVTPGAEETYMKFGWGDLGAQLGVTANELVDALHQHTRTIEYDLEVPGSSPVMSRAQSAMSRPASGLMSRARSGLSALAAPFTGHVAPPTPPAAASEQSEQTHQATGFIVLVPAVSEAEAAPPVSTAGAQGEVGAEEPAAEVVEAPVPAEVLPMTHFMADLTSQGAEAEEPEILGESDGAYSSDDLETPMLKTSGSFDHSEIGRSTAYSRSTYGGDEHQPSGFLFKVVDGGRPVWDPHAELDGQVLSSTPQSVNHLLDNSLYREYCESLPDETPDTYALAVPDMPEGEDDTVAFKSLMLPSDITSVKVQAQEQETVDGEKVTTLQVTVERRSPVIGYVLLALAVWGVSTLGAGFAMFHGVDPVVKSIWRSEVTLLVITPLMLASLCHNPHCFNCCRDVSTMMSFALTSFGSAGYIAFFVASLAYINMGTAFLLSNCHCILIVGFRMITGQAVSALESIGVFVGMTGAALATMDGAGGEGNSLLQSLIHLDTPLTASNTATGGLLGLASGISGAIYITAASKSRQKMEFSVFMWLLLLAHLLIFTGAVAIMKLVEGLPLSSALTFSCDPVTGVLGWTAPQNLPAAILVGVVGTILGTCCYIAVMKYLDSVVVSVTMLSEPFMGVANGVLLHQATWPGPLGWIGSIVSILGAMVVIIGSRRRSITASVSH